MKAWFRLGFKFPIHHYCIYTLAVFWRDHVVLHRQWNVAKTSGSHIFINSSMDAAFELCQEFRGKKSLCPHESKTFIRHCSPYLALFPEESLPWQMKLLVGGHPSDLRHADGLGASFVSLKMKSLWYCKDSMSSLCGSAWRSSSTKFISHFLANSSSLHLLTLTTSFPWGMIVCNSCRSCQGAPQKKSCLSKGSFSTNLVGNLHYSTVVQGSPPCN